MPNVNIGIVSEIVPGGRRAIASVKDRLPWEPLVCLLPDIDDCSISIANALEILQSCTEPSICASVNPYQSDLIW